MNSDLLTTTQNNAPVVAFVTGSLLLGSLINTYPPGSPDQISSTQVCPQRNDTNIATGFLPTPAVAVLTLLFPLLPILITGRCPDPKLLTSHIVGQTGSFSTSELARYLIVKPNAQFFQDCQISPETCLATAILQPLVANDGICNNTTTSDYDTLRNNLHGFPDVISSLVGSAIASFFLAMAARKRRKKKYMTQELNARKEEEGDVENNDSKYCIVKPYVQFLFVITSFGAIILLLVDRYTQSVNTLFEMFFSVLLGASFQLAVHYFLASGGSSQTGRLPPI